LAGANQTYVEIIVHKHADGGEDGGGEPDDELHLDDERVGDGRRAGARRVARLAELHDGEHEAEQRGGAERHGEPGAVLRPRHPRGPVPARVHPEHRGADAEQRHGVHRERREPLAHEQQREGGREGQLRGDEDGGRGDRQVGEAVGVEEVVEAGHEADARGRRQEAGRHEEERRAAGRLRGRLLAAAAPAPAAPGEGRAERHEQDREAGRLEEGREPLAGAAVEEIGTE